MLLRLRLLRRDLEPFGHRLKIRAPLLIFDPTLLFLRWRVSRSFITFYHGLLILL